MQPIDNRSADWKLATVTKRLGPRAYLVTTPDGRQYRRTRRHLRPAKHARVPDAPFFFPSSSHPDPKTPPKSTGPTTPDPTALPPQAKI